jgi:hypothetical protein
MRTVELSIVLMLTVELVSALLTVAHVVALS